MKLLGDIAAEVLADRWRIKKALRGIASSEGQLTIKHRERESNASGIAHIAEYATTHRDQRRISVANVNCCGPGLIPAAGFTWYRAPGSSANSGIPRIPAPQFDRVSFNAAAANYERGGSHPEGRMEDGSLCTGNRWGSNNPVPFETV